MLQDRTVRAECSFFSEHCQTRVSPLVHFICGSPFLTLAAFCSLRTLNSASQGDILTVIRRLDEHWIEARLGDKVGVCPLQFTEVSPSDEVLLFFPPRPSRAAHPRMALEKHLQISAQKGFWLVQHLRLLTGVGFAGPTVVFLCTFCLRELTSAAAGRNLTVAAFGLNVPP